MTMLLAYNIHSIIHTPGCTAVSGLGLIQNYNSHQTLIIFSVPKKNGIHVSIVQPEYY